MANNSLEQKIIDYLGFDPNNEEFIRDLVEKDNFSIRDVRLILNPSEEIQLLAIRGWPNTIKYIRNPTIKVQLEAIRLSKYDLNVIMYCPNYKEFEEEIMSNLIIKDIIE
jgi:hypothetical protein